MVHRETLCAFLFVSLAAIVLSSFTVKFAITAPVSIEVPAQYGTIQEAIDAAAINDTISVGPGTYNENLIINKTIALKGIDPINTIINGNGNGTVIKITAKNVLITGFTICNSSELEAGVHIQNTADVTVKGNTIDHCGIGLKIDRSNNSIIEDNIFSQNSLGIRIWYYSKANFISNNVIQNNGNGVDLRTNVHNTNVTWNQIANNSYGVYISNSWDNNIQWNNIANNSFDGVFLYGVKATGNAIRSNNITRNKRGIYIWISKSNIIYNNNFLNNTLQAQIEGESVNTWSSTYPEGGNYWSNYVGTDMFAGVFQNLTGSDGIIDISYILNINNVDYYPWIRELTAPTVTGSSYADFIGVIIILFVIGAVFLVLLPMQLMKPRRLPGPTEEADEESVSQGR